MKREKTTATLLIAIFMISIFALAIPVLAQGAILHVGSGQEYATIQEAIDAAEDGDTILVGPGYYAGVLVTKSVKIVGEDGAIINDGPVHGSGLIQGFRMLAGSDGAVISHLRFEVDFAIMNGEAVDDVTISHNVIIDSIQGVSNWRGSGWKIVHNTIIDLRTANGGGIGILLADWTGGTVEDNIVSHNRISGTLHVDPNDGGGYDGSGIVLYADFRWGGAGAEEISGNLVTHNKVSLVSDDSDVVDVVACELTDTREVPDEDDPLISGNKIGFNDFRGTELQIVYTPTYLEGCNVISRNLGDNRGHATVNPAIFKPN